MFASKARSLPKSAATERCFSQVGSGLIQKLEARRGLPAKDKHSSLLGPPVIFYNIGLCLHRQLLNMKGENIMMSF
jgi:hypothetical protein